MSDAVKASPYDFTVTGRIRNAAPNMQQLPRTPRTEIEPLIEEARRALEELTDNPKEPPMIPDPETPATDTVTPMPAATTAKPRGFAALPPEVRHAISSKGGKAAHAAGTAHEFDTAEARRAGQKGGVATRTKRAATNTR